MTLSGGLETIEDYGSSNDSSADEDEAEWGGIPDVAPPVLAVKAATKKPIPRLFNSDADAEDDSELPEVPGLTTWAQRNPGKPVVQAKTKARRVLGPEQRRTLEDKRKTKKMRATELQTDIVALNRERADMVDELAAKHRFKAKFVKQKLLGVSVFKKSRKTSLFRAKLHYLGKKLNEGLSV